MNIFDLNIKDLKVIEPVRIGDNRGYFSEIYHRKILKELGIEVTFIQDNCSFSLKKYTLRGLHFQSLPLAQDKLVRVTRGKILDVAVDLRKDSPTYLHYETIKLSAENWKQLFIPKGFAHGFLTLEPRTEVIYKVSEYYSPQHDEGIIWSDPDLAIDWGISGIDPILSNKDRNLPYLADLTSFF